MTDNRLSNPNEFEPISTAKFYFEVDGITDKMVKKVSDIKFEGTVKGYELPIAIQKGGIELRQATSVGYESNPEITIETYICQEDYNWYEWMRAVMPVSDGGEASWSGNRKDGSLVAYDSDTDPESQDPAKEIMRWNFRNMWIKEYTVSEFNVENSGLATETFKIVYEWIDRVK